MLQIICSIQSGLLDKIKMRTYHKIQIQECLPSFTYSKPHLERGVANRYITFSVWLLYRSVLPFIDLLLFLAFLEIISSDVTELNSAVSPQLLTSRETKKPGEQDMKKRGGGRKERESTRSGFCMVHFHCGDSEAR